MLNAYHVSAYLSGGEDDASAFVSASSPAEAVALWHEWAKVRYPSEYSPRVDVQVRTIPKSLGYPGVHEWHTLPPMLEDWG